MKITVKMPTGKFKVDNDGEFILDDEGNKIEIREDSEFESPFIPSKVMKKAINISNEIEKEKDDMDPESFDKMGKLIVQVFGWQFTKKDVDEGISSENLLVEFGNCISIIFGKLNTKLGKLEKTNPNV